MLCYIMLLPAYYQAWIMVGWYFSSLHELYCYRSYHRCHANCTWMLTQLSRPHQPYLAVEQSTQSDLYTKFHEMRSADGHEPAWKWNDRQCRCRERVSYVQHYKYYAV